MSVQQAASAHTLPRRKANERTRIRERQYTVLFYTAMICVFSHALLEDAGISISVVDSLVRPAFLLGGACCCLLMNDKLFLQKLRGKPYLLLLPVYSVFLILMTASSYYTKDIVPVYNPITKNILFQGYVVEGVGLILYALVMGRTRQFQSFLFICLAALTLMSDLLMFTGPKFTDGAFETYLIGTKFDVAYAHMNLMALFFTQLSYYRKGRKDVKLPLRLLLSFMAINVIISLRVDCNTGMLGSLLIVVITYICDRYDSFRNKLFGSVWFFAFTLIISTTFAYYIFWILEQPIVQYLVVEKMGRSLTLTGRTDIYALFPSSMQEHWMWGYGYGNAFPVCVALYGYTDVQNAVLQWVLQVGVPATIAMCLVFCYIMKLYRDAGCSKKLVPIIALIYMYLLLGTVEITINLTFWLFMLLLFMLSCEDMKTPDRRRLPTNR